MKLKYTQLTEQIIGAFYTVYNGLGYGFLEKVYRNALTHELRSKRLNVLTEHPISVFYVDVCVGEYFADLIVADKIIIELKRAEAISDAHRAQLINYLQATRYEVGLVLNFGPKPSFERRFFSNDKKSAFKKEPAVICPIRVIRVLRF